MPLKVGSLDSRIFSRAIVFFPVVGGIIGIVNSGLYLLLKQLLPLEVLAVVLIALPIFMSGGMHFDGLLDSCDGIFSGRSRERSLEIMRDSRVGSMGVIAGILNILLRYTLLVSLPVALLPALLITQPVTGRWVMSIAVHFFPYARKEGGLGQGFNENKRVLFIVLSTGLAFLIAFAVSGLSSVGTLALTGFLSLLIALWAANRLGGLTGDVYGGLNETGEILYMMIWLLGLNLGL